MKPSSFARKIISWHSTSILSQIDWEFYSVDVMHCTRGRNQKSRQSSHHCLFRNGCGRRLQPVTLSLCISWLVVDGWKLSPLGTSLIERLLNRTPNAHSEAVLHRRGVSFTSMSGLKQKLFSDWHEFKHAKCKKNAHILPSVWARGAKRCFLHVARAN